MYVVNFWNVAYVGRPKLLIKLHWHAINNLAAAQVRKDTPSLIGVKGLGRPKEIIVKEREIFSSGRRRRRHSLQV